MNDASSLAFRGVARFDGNPAMTSKGEFKVTKEFVVEQKLHVRACCGKPLPWQKG
jgi:hypothetical protein